MTATATVTAATAGTAATAAAATTTTTTTTDTDPTLMQYQPESTSWNNAAAVTTEYYDFTLWGTNITCIF